MADLMLLLAASAVFLFYVNRIFPELPLYATDEGAYLIGALYGDSLAARPDLHPSLHPVGNTVYVLLIRLVDLLSLNVLPWLRLIGLAAHLGSLWLLYRALDGRRGDPIFAGLLLALAYPFYRFVVTAMPEGLYVLALALLTALAARLAPRRPLVHAVLAGGLAGVLVLLKPHGVVAIPAMGALLCATVFLRLQSARAAAAQGLVYVAAFLAAGAAIQVAAGAPGPPLTFFLGGAYTAQLAGEPVEPIRTGLTAAVGLTSATLLLASLPLWAIARDLWRRRARKEAPSADALAGLFLAAALLATLTMILVFAVKISAMTGEQNRLWGRYFEFYVPLLWIAAARPLCGLWVETSRGGRWALAAAPVLGGVGLLLTAHWGVTLFPWDSAALTAFFVAHPERWPSPLTWPIWPIALAIMAAAGAALALGARPARTCTAAFVGLGLLSTAYDDAWVGRDVAASRARLEHELHLARALTDGQPGPAVVVAHDTTASHIAFLRYGGQVHVRVRPPGVLPTEALAAFDDLVVIGPERPPAPWQAIFEGDSLTVFRKAAP